MTIKTRIRFFTLGVLTTIPACTLAQETTAPSNKKAPSAHKADGHN
jgi:hypothetical protein